MMTMGTGASPAPYARMQRQTAAAGTHGQFAVLTRNPVPKVAMHTDTTRELHASGIYKNKYLPYLFEMNC
jgi:hypothetical protein